MGRTAILVEQNWNAVPGGTARATNRLIEALLAHTDCDLVGVHGAHPGAPRLELPKGLTVERLPLPGRPMAESWSRFGRPSIDRWVAADVVHAPAYVLPPTRAAQVVTIHDLAFVRHPEWFTPHGVRYFNRFLDRVRESDALVVVPSIATANDCLSRGIDQARIRTVAWGIDTAVATSDEIESARTRYSLPENFILFVGTVEPRKNLSTLIDAVSRIGNAQLVVVGPAGWGDVELPGATVLGAVPDGDVAPIMAAASVLAYPSHFEGFGLPVLEAMAQGTPVLTTSNTAPSELAGEAGVSVDTHSPQAIADALRGLLESPSERARLGLVGQTRAAEYSWEETARVHAAIYEELS